MVNEHGTGREHESHRRASHRAANPNATAHPASTHLLERLQTLKGFSLRSRDTAGDLRRPTVDPGLTETTNPADSHPGQGS